VLILSGAALWIAILSMAYVAGNAQETRPSLDTTHVALSVGATVVLLGLIAARLWGVGLADQSDSATCADYCLAEGFSGSGMPPRDSGDRTCTCYDAQG
jgi:hypothetical protein